jgi:aminoglycoside phosphotransferase (APT) family kinase protein
MEIWDEQPGLAAWVEQTLDGRITRAERQGRWRVQWMIDVETAGGHLPVLARMPRDPEYVRLVAFTDHYDTRRESRVLEALHDAPVPTPRCYGFHEPTETILQERVPGTADFAALSDEAQRRAVLHRYVEHLAAVHALDAEVFERAGVASRAESATPGGQLRWMRVDYERARAHMRPEPLLDFSLRWLDANVPADRPQRHVVQGDTGPGQFLFDGDEITALIDWELADIDDPMLDLGVMRMRNVLYPMGSIEGALLHYAATTGVTLDLGAIRYHTVLASLVSPLGMAPSMQTPTATIDSMLPRLAWDVTMRRCLCEALLEANGLQPDPPSIPPAEPTPRTGLHDFFVEYLETTCAPLAAGEYGRYLLLGAGGLARAMRLLDQIGPALDDADLDDMAAVLGHRPADRLAGDIAIAEIVATQAEKRTADLLRMWHRIAVRREVAWAPLMVAQGSGPFVPLPDDFGRLALAGTEPTRSLDQPVAPRGT